MSNIRPRRQRNYLSTSKKEKILESQGYQCVYCQDELNILNPPQYDHFVPYVKGGRVDDVNIFASCGHCNRRKGDKIFNSMEEAKEFLLSVPGVTKSLTCIVCGEGFKTRKTNVKICSEECQRKQRCIASAEGRRRRIAMNSTSKTGISEKE